MSNTVFFLLMVVVILGVAYWKRKRWPAPVIWGWLVLAPIAVVYFLR